MTKIKLGKLGNISALIRQTESNRINNEFNNGINKFINAVVGSYKCVMMHGLLRIYFNGGNLMCGGDYITFNRDTNKFINCSNVEVDLQSIDVSLCVEAIVKCEQLAKLDKAHIKQREFNLKNERNLNKELKEKYHIAANKVSDKAKKEIDKYERRQAGIWKDSEP